jgi:prolyl-tRNA editing enzyme YbaK/EbsC (Cys-tRNA(Pro) deacylase)
VDEEPTVVIKSGVFRVDLVKLCERAGTTSARQASPDEVREATGQSIGGVSPAGWPRPLRVFIDDSLEQFDRLWSACGTPNAVFATDYDELRVLTDASPISLVER